MKTRYFNINVDQTGIESIAFWRSLTEEEFESLSEECGSIEEASRGDSEDSDASVRLVLSQEEMVQLRDRIDKALAKPEKPEGGNIAWAIIETWNGEGYSSLNTARLFQGTAKQAEAEVKRIVAEQCPTHSSSTASGGGGYLVAYEIDEDQGTVQAIPFGPEHVGVVIYCNVNEVKVVTEDEWASELSEALEQADDDHNDDEPTEELAPFIGAFNGDYDYQFVALALNCKHCGQPLENSAGKPFCSGCGRPTPEFAQYGN